MTPRATVAGPGLSPGGTSSGQPGVETPGAGQPGAPWAISTPGRWSGVNRSGGWNQHSGLRTRLGTSSTRARVPMHPERGLNRAVHRLRVVQVPDGFVDLFTRSTGQEVQPVI